MNNLLEFRKRKNLTMNDMVNRMKVSFSFYEKVERGYRKPSRNFMEKLKSAFPDADINELFFN